MKPIVYDFPIDYNVNDYIKNHLSYFEKFKLKYPEATFKDFLSSEINRYGLYKENAKYLYKYHGQKPPPIIEDKNDLGRRFESYWEEGDIIEEIALKVKDDYTVRTNTYLGFKNIDRFIQSELHKPLIASNSSNDETNFEDLSDSNLAEKIIYLNELGLLDFMRDKFKNYTVNSLASVLSGIIGEKQSSIQSYLNPIFNDSSNDKSPYKNEKNLSKVRKHLIERNFWNE